MIKEVFRIMQSDLSGLKQLPDQRTIQLEIDPSTGQSIGPARKLLIPGLLRRIRGK